MRTSVHADRAVHASAELRLGHVSTVSVTDVIVDEAAPLLLPEPHAASEGASFTHDTTDAHS